MPTATTTKTVLKPDTIKMMRKLASEDFSYSEISKMFKVPYITVYFNVTGRRNAHIK